MDFETPVMDGPAAVREIRRIGHNRKGTGAGYGFPRLTEIGAELEAAALRLDTSAIREQLEHLPVYLEYGAGRGRHEG